MSLLAHRVFQVHAEWLGTSTLLSERNDAVAGNPLRRRLNRMERVVAAHRGQIDKRLKNGLQIEFETADACILASREMQDRCAVLPQLSGNGLALRIGVHLGIARRRSGDLAADPWEIASRLAFLDDGIVASGVVIMGLNPELRKLAVHMLDLAPETNAYKVDWRREISSAAFGGETLRPTINGVRPSGPYLILHHGLKTFELTQRVPVVAVGRSPLCDLILVDDRVSRNHCRIERRIDCIMLTDSSSNGTFVNPDNGEELLVMNNSEMLRGKGLLFFGRSFEGDRRGGIRYEAY